MQVIINETKEVKNLTIIDDATGTEWTRDLLGNCNIHTDSDNFYHMDSADYDWWAEEESVNLPTEAETPSESPEQDEERHELELLIL